MSQFPELYAIPAMLFVGLYAVGSYFGVVDWGNDPQTWTSMGGGGGDTLGRGVGWYLEKRRATPATFFWGKLSVVNFFHRCLFTFAPIICVTSFHQFFCLVSSWMHRYRRCHESKKTNVFFQLNGRNRIGPSHKNRRGNFVFFRFLLAFQLISPHFFLNTS